MSTCPEQVSQYTDSGGCIHDKVGIEGRFEEKHKACMEENNIEYVEIDNYRIVTPDGDYYKAKFWAYLYTGREDLVELYAYLNERKDNRGHRPRWRICYTKDMGEGLGFPITPSQSVSILKELVERPDDPRLEDRLAEITAESLVKNRKMIE